MGSTCMISLNMVILILMSLDGKKTISPEEVKTNGFSTTAGLGSGFKGTNASSKELSSTFA